MSFSVSDGTTYASGNLGSGAACYETTSELITGTCTPASRNLTLNAVAMTCNGSNEWSVPLPTQRHHGYCIQADAGSNQLSFSVR